ncbi:MAG: penicillin-binding protein [Nocardioides sp.]|nr:penicillin-binding protein [Nocardioides sp.]
MRRALGSTALLLLPLVACSADEPSPPGPQAVAADLARGLAAGDVSGVGFEGGGAAAQASYVVALGDLVDLDPTVTLGRVVEAEAEEGAEEGDGDGNGATATATLAWSWPLGAQAWTYESEVPLTRAGETWQATWSSAVVEPDLGEGESFGLGPEPAERGDVLGAGGAVLVTERAVQVVGLDRTLVAADAAGVSARALARLVGVEAKAYVAAVEAAGPQAFVAAITYRDAQVPPDVDAALARIGGARRIEGRQPLAPTREFAAPVLGRVGPVTAEMVAESPESYRAGDVAGLSGLQARYDAVLRGTPGQVVTAVPATGDPHELFRIAPVAGQDLTLTLDERLQTAAEQALAEVGPASAVVALRPSTGDVLAAANGPGNDGQNLATFGQYAPGSTFKIVSSLALLRAGLTPTSRVPCSPTLTVDGKAFTNYSDYPTADLGDIALRTALASSCNTAFISQADQLDDQGGDLAASAQALGLGIDHEVGFPAYFGQVEPPASLTQAAADLIGQGTVLASPMTMAAVIGSVQQGAGVVPRLVSAPALPADTAPAPTVPLTPAEADTLRTMLRGVVTDGSGVGLADVPGAPVIAKTGTAEFGTGPDLATHAWMVAAQGDLAVAVFVDVGQSGSSTAGPILEAFLRAVG